MAGPVADYLTQGESPGLEGGVNPTSNYLSASETFLRR
jgi:hypothetical protein